MAIAHVTRARKAGVTLTAVDLGRVYHEARGICGVCQKHVPFDVFTVDHIYPMSKGGLHVAANLQIAHSACNSSKSNRLPSGLSE